MTKKQFITKLLHERDKFEQLLNRVGFTRRMTIKGVSGKWSIKDIIAHILAYEQYIADRMSEILQGQPYTPCKTQTALDAFLDEFGYPDFGSSLLEDDTPNTWPVWTPDGRWIVFGSFRGGTAGMWRVQPGGGQVCLRAAFGSELRGSPINCGSGVI